MSNPSLILRIDDRLIHGQVLIGWGTYYPIKYFVVGDDEIAANEWERNLLLMAVSPDFDAQILTIAETRQYIETHLQDREMSMVLVSSPYHIKQMAEMGLSIKKINIGGIHFNEGRREYLPYLFLSHDEIDIFKQLIQEGFTFECQDVPTGDKNDLAKILEKHKR